MDDIRPELLSYAKAFDEAIDEALPLISHPHEKHHPPRYKVAFTLLEQLINVAKSINRLTKIQANVSMQALDENAQAIISLSRVMTEASNKFYYIAIDPNDQKDLILRWRYFLLVGSIRYKRMTSTIELRPDHPEDADTIQKAKDRIKKAKDDLVRDGLLSWQPYLDLPDDEKKKVRKGVTPVDYLRTDFDAAMVRRIKETERKHFEEVGHANVHSSSFVYFFRSEKEKKPDTFMAGVTSLALYNLSSHLALCGLELLRRFDDFHHLITPETVKRWEERSSTIRAAQHLSHIPDKRQAQESPKEIT